MKEKIILIPDSFKSSMTSIEVVNIMEEAIIEDRKDLEIIKIPIADGGEGSIDSLLTTISGRKVFCQVNSPLKGIVESYFGLIDNDQTAIIEIAQAIGFIHKNKEMNPDNTSSYGVGQLIIEALNMGVKKIIMCIGGSITNDGGCGIASCLGAKFYNINNEIFIPRGETLKDIVKIEVDSIDPRLSQIELVALVDVNNPLYGPTGAAYIYARQKGADDEMIMRLDDGLNHLAKICKEELKKDYSKIPGAGAAGGIGFGLVSLLGFTMKGGINYILDVVGYEEKVKDANYVITGEGKFDKQSLMGKVISGIVERTKPTIPIIVVCGNKEDNLETDLLVFETNKKRLPFEIAKITAKEDLKMTMKEVLKQLK